MNNMADILGGNHRILLNIRLKYLMKKFEKTRTCEEISVATVSDGSFEYPGTGLVWVQTTVNLLFVQS